jgi:GNAT superfamily N-acetyltransferase
MKACQISLAAEADAPEILAMQRLAWEPEARLYEDWTIPPLTQTLEELRADIRGMTVLKALWDERIVGSVRARQTGETCEVGRLMVHPDRHRQGIGYRLMLEIESYFPTAARFELFTGAKSVKQLRLYARLGYQPTREETYSPLVTLVFMEKRPGAHLILTQGEQA